MAASRFLCGIALALLLAGAQASPRLRIQTVSLAGFAFHEGRSLWPQLHEGDALTLTHETENAHDPLAVRVDWQGHALGYLPREQSAPVAAALDRGSALSARIARLREHPNPRERILIEVFADL